MTRAAQVCPDKAALIFCHSAGDETVTYAELDQAARGQAAWLLEHHRPGDRALLLHPPGTEFVKAFLGCAYAGLVAVPAPPPDGDRRQLDRACAIVKDADVALVLSDSSLADRLAHQLQRPVTASDTLAGEGWVAQDLGPDALALLQYTSGSTSEPKGVMVTYRNLLANIETTGRQGDSGPDDVMIGWLPHFHDMGLIGMLLHLLYVRATTVHMSPLTFLRRPVRWLEEATRKKGTLLLAPDFAYDLCARVVTAEQAAALDLSGIRWAMNGAEPVRRSTLERFARRFAPSGFRPEVFGPCYGMAEVTLMATITRPASPPVYFPADARGLERDEVRRGEPITYLAGCGQVTQEPEVRIVDPDGHAVLAAGRVGEIWLGGQSVAAGYWRRPESTQEVFHARTSEGEGPFLRTGDLGAIIDGELYVTGRLKDVLIVRGRNIYPQDLEHLVREIHPALGAGIGVAFAVADRREHIVIVHEVKKGLLDGDDLAHLAARIKLTVAKSAEIPAPSVVLTNRGAVPRTTSGKVRRAEMRALFLSGRVQVLHEELSPAVEAIQQAWSARETPTG